MKYRNIFRTTSNHTCNNNRVESTLLFFYGHCPR